MTAKYTTIYVDIHLQYNKIKDDKFYEKSRQAKEYINILLQVSWAIAFIALIKTGKKLFMDYWKYII